MPLETAEPTASVASASADGFATETAATDHVAWGLREAEEPTIPSQSPDTTFSVTASLEPPETVAYYGRTFQKADLEVASLLYEAIVLGDRASVVTLVEAGANIALEYAPPLDSFLPRESIFPNWQTPLITAIKHDKPSIVTYLLDNGSDPNAFDSRGYNAMHHAANNGNIAVGKALLSHWNLDSESFRSHFRARHAGWPPPLRVDFDPDVTPLHLAVKNNNTGFAQLLIENYANVHRADGDGNTALHYAALKGNIQSYILLRNHCADKYAENRKGENVIDFARIRKLHLSLQERREFYDLVKLDLNSEELKGMPPILWASMDNHRLQMVTHLVQLGHEVNVRFEGVTPLDLAVTNRKREMARVLLAGGADPNSLDDEGLTPLHWAIATEDEGMVQILLQFGANPLFKNGDVPTPLALARYKGRLGMVRLMENPPVQIGVNLRQPPECSYFGSPERYNIR